MQEEVEVEINGLLLLLLVQLELEVHVVVEVDGVSTSTSTCASSLLFFLLELTLIQHFDCCVHGMVPALVLRGSVHQFFGRNNSSSSSTDFAFWGSFFAKKIPLFYFFLIGSGNISAN